MSDLFEEDKDVVGVDVGDDSESIEEVDVESEIDEVAPRDLDARRRLENMLDEKRLRDELDDFVDY